MSIDKKIHQRNKKLKTLYPIADDNIRKKTNAELHLNGFLLHKNFIRFAFAFLSFILYVPTIIELFQNSFITIDYIRNFIILIILILLEIGLSFSLYNLYIRKHSDNNINIKTLKTVAFSIAAVSIILSALSGVNAIDITDNGKENAISQTRTEKKEDISEFKEMIEKNDLIISNNNHIIRENNVLIRDLKAVSVTRKGSAQIVSYQARNKELQSQNKTLIAENNKLRADIKEIRQAGDKLMEDRIKNAGKKELIYMIIFFLAGIISVRGLMFSYNFIGQYYYYLAKEAAEIEALEEYTQEKEEKETQEAIKKKKRLNKIELENIELEKKIQAARENEETGTWEPEKKKE